MPHKQDDAGGSINDGSKNEEQTAGSIVSDPSPCSSQARSSGQINLHHVVESEYPQPVNPLGVLTSWVLAVNYISDGPGLSEGARPAVLFIASAYLRGTTQSLGFRFYNLTSGVAKKP